MVCGASLRVLVHPTDLLPGRRSDGAPVLGLRHPTDQHLAWWSVGAPVEGLASARPTEWSVERPCGSWCILQTCYRVGGLMERPCWDLGILQTSIWHGGLSERPWKDLRPRGQRNGLLECPCGSWASCGPL
jgi:hypothetical protein